MTTFAESKMRVALLAVVLITGCQRAAGCPEMSGRYVIQGEDGRSYITIAQHGCDRATLQWRHRTYMGQDSTIHELIMDGRAHPDRGWLDGRDTNSTTAAYLADTLRVVTRQRSSADTARTERYDFVRLANGDLCYEAAIGSSGYALVAVRLGPDGEDAAALRSEQYGGGRTRSCRQRG